MFKQYCVRTFDSLETLVLRLRKDYIDYWYLFEPICLISYFITLL